MGRLTDIVTTIKDTVADIGQWVIDKITDFVQGVFDSVTSLFECVQADLDTLIAFGAEALAGQSTQSCPFAGAVGVAFGSEEESLLRVGVALSFHPVLFRILENPADEADFHALNPPEFPSNYLLADGVSSGIVAIHLLLLNPDGAAIDPPEYATQADHQNDGNIVLELADETCGTLSYRGQSGRTVVVPVADAATRSVVFTTSQRLAETTLKATINDQYAYQVVENFEPPPATGLQRVLSVGSRLIAAAHEGHDVLKLQWYLRRVGFKQYDERDVPASGSASEWHNFSELRLDGVFAGGTQRASRDFQRVATGAFRNQATVDVPVTFAGAVTPSVSEAVTRELRTWYERSYTVECHHGIARLRHADAAGPLAEDVIIVYGALVAGDRSRGHVQIEISGKSICHFDAWTFHFANALNTEIRLLEQDKLIFRLHDADPNRELDEPEVHLTLRDRVESFLRAVRRKQTADYAGRMNRDVRVHFVYRTFAHQNQLYQIGRRGRPDEDIVTGARGGFSWHNYGLAADVVFCNENGGPSWANGDEGTPPYDWQRLGLHGTTHNLNWGAGWGDFAHWELPGLQDGHTPTRAIRRTYRNTRGTVMQKIQAVWTAMGI